MVDPVHVYVYIDPNDQPQRAFVAMLRKRSSVESSLVSAQNGATPRILIKMSDGSMRRFSGPHHVRDFFAKYPK